MGRERVHTFARPLRYRPRTIRLRDGSTRSILIGEEKGIDVRLALDAVRMAHRREYDVALVLSRAVNRVTKIALRVAGTSTRHLVLLTGVPGAGKTRVGLQHVTDGDSGLFSFA